MINTIIEAWGWIGICPRVVVGENPFGNLIVEDSEGRYWRISPEHLACTVIAQNRQELDSLSQNQEFLADWYVSGWVELAKEKYGELVLGRKYCFKLPGVLGGSYDISNFTTIDFDELIRFSGDLAHQISDLPDGANIKLKVID